MAKNVPAPSEQKEKQNKRPRRSGRTAAVRVLTWALRLCVLLLVLMIGYALVTTAFGYGYRIFSKKGAEEAPGRDVIVVITEKMSASDTGKLLQSKGLIADANVFWAQRLFYGSRIYPGTYTLNTSMSGQRILRIISTKPEESTEASEEETGTPTQKEPETGSAAQYGETQETEASPQGDTRP